MASALRPTPETGRVAATKMPASAIGPSWTKRAGREARLAFRQAQRSGDREQAMRIAMQAEEAGLPAQASIGSAERRLAGQYQGRGADTAITAEVASALTPPAVDTAGRPRMTNDMRRGDPGFQEQPSQIISTDSSGQPTVDGRPIPVRGSANWKGASPVRTAGFRDAAMSAGNMGIDPRTGRRLVDESEVASPTPEQTPVPGATEPPENPVSGSRVPATGDAESRLGGRRINPLTGKPLGFDPRNPSPVDTMSRIRELTAADGENLTRGAAVRKVNDERRAAGQAPVDYEDTLDELQAADRETESSRRRGAAMNRGPTLSVDPDLARSFRSGGTERRATPPARLSPPSRASVLGGSPTTPAPRPESPILTRYTMTSPEARAAAQVAKLKEQALRARQGRESLLARKQREIKIPEWQEGTILGQLNRRFQEASLEAGMRTGTLQR